MIESYMKRQQVEGYWTLDLQIYLRQKVKQHF